VAYFLDKKSSIYINLDIFDNNKIMVAWVELKLILKNNVHTF